MILKSNHNSGNGQCTDGKGNQELIALGKKSLQETAYRTTHLLVRRVEDAQVIEIPSEGFQAIQSLPGFMDGWAREALKIQDPRKILTSTVNVTDGCPIGGKSLCGTYCFAHLSWKGSEVREETPQKYMKDMQKLRELGVGVSLFLSTDTEPFPGKGKISEVTFRLLITMTELPPDGLLIHSHADHIGDPRNVELLQTLSTRTRLITGIGFETDSEEVAHLPKHHSSVKSRVDALRNMAKAGITTQATLSPLMGFNDFKGFARMFRDLGAYRVMVGELKTEFENGGSEKARELNFGLPYPPEKEAIEYIRSLNFPGGVGRRELFYVLSP